MTRMKRQKASLTGLALAVLLGAGCASAPKITLRLHEQVSGSLPAGRIREIEVASTGQQLTIDPFPALTEKDVLEAQLFPTAGGDAVLLRFDLHGANLLDELTTRARGEYVVVLWDERPVAAVLLNERITNGQFLLEGDFTDEEAKAIVESLNKLAGRPRDYGDTRHAP
jgi:preprotein translocase subunit SecD